MALLAGDPRYSVRKEFTGDYHDRPGLLPGQMWVVRFCDGFVAAVPSREEAIVEVAKHQSERVRRLTEEHAAWMRAHAQPLPFMV